MLETFQKLPHNFWNLMGTYAGSKKHKHDGRKRMFQKATQQKRATKRSEFRKIGDFTSKKTIDLDRRSNIVKQRTYGPLSRVFIALKK